MLLANISAPSYVGADSGQYSGVLSYTLETKIAVYAGESYPYMHIIVDATDLKEYANGVGTMGYWAGFHVAIPEGATKLYLCYTGYDDEQTLEALLAKTLTQYTDLATEGCFQSYPDHSRTKERWVRLQWKNDEDEVIEDSIYYYDGTGVTLEGETPPTSPLTSDVVEALTKDRLPLYTKEILDAVNSRIENRFTELLNAESDDRHYPTAKTTYEGIESRSKIRSLVVASGDPTEVAITPDEKTVYVVRKAATDVKGFTYVWDATIGYILIGTTDVKDGDGLVVTPISEPDIKSIVASAYTATNPNLA